MVDDTDGVANHEFRLVNQLDELDEIAKLDGSQLKLWMKPDPEEKPGPDQVDMENEHQQIEPVNQKEELINP